MYKIIKNKPLPAPRGGNTSKYPFAKLKVGDAFEVPCGDVKRSATQNNVSSAARAYAVKHSPKAKFLTRIVDGSVWCWRTV